MSDAFSRIHQALITSVEIVKDTGHGKIQAQCPAHDDRTPSLSVTPIEGQTLVYCHAGCSTRDVVDALGLKLSDLYDIPKGAEYHYPDGRVVHRAWDAKKKAFRKFRQSGDTTGSALYRADRLADAGTVYVVEGEKDVHALEALGVSATCNPMGAGKAHRFDWTPLAGSDVVIVADNDADGTGHKHAREVVDQLDGVAASTVVVQAKVGKDAAEHVAAGYGLDEFQPADNVLNGINRSEHGEWPDSPAPIEHIEPIAWHAPRHRTGHALWDMADAIATGLQVPYELAVMDCLGALFTAIGNRRTVTVWPGWIEQVAFYGVTAADPGERKTTSQDAAFGPLVNWAAAIRTAEYKEVEKQRSRRANLLSQLDKIKHPKGKDQEFDGDAFDRLQDQLEQSPERNHFQIETSDATPEALAATLHDQDEQLTVRSDEGGMFATLLGRYASGQANLDLTNKSYDGKRVTVDRRSSDQIMLDSPVLTFSLSVQPAVLRGMAERRDDVEGTGFLGRFVMALPQTKRGTRTGRTQGVPTEVDQRYEHVLKDVATRVRRRSRQALALSEPAQDVLEAFCDECEIRQRDNGGDLVAISSWASKLGGKVARIAAALTVMDQPDADTVEAAAVGDAVELARQFIPHTQAAWSLMFGRRTEHVQLCETADSVLNVLNRETGTVTLRDVHQPLRRRAWVNPAAGGGGVELVEQYMHELVQMDWLGQSRREAGGRVRYAVHPELIGCSSIEHIEHTSGDRDQHSDPHSVGDEDPDAFSSAGGHTGGPVSDDTDAPQPRPIDLREMPVTAHRSTSGKVWLLTGTCPFCGREHTHGGGDGNEPERPFGLRVPHCPIDEDLGLGLTHYRLVPAQQEQTSPPCQACGDPLPDDFDGGGGDAPVHFDPDCIARYKQQQEAL